MAVLDIKLGYECNNNCFHCVIGPERERERAKGISRLERSYKEVIELIDGSEMQKYHIVVLTGGEPTIRSDFLRIVKHIHRRYPDKLICVQTNGRMLWKYLDQIKEEGVKIFYVIAIHGPEQVHNEICNSRDWHSNPFQETMRTIKRVIELYEHFREVARIEIVLSRKNLRYLKETIEMLRDIGANRIGISYPHLDGYERISPDEVRKRGFSYAEMQEELKAVVDLASKNKELKIGFEAVPMCALRDSEGNIYGLPANVELIDYTESKNATVVYLDAKCDNFKDIWWKIHGKFAFCSECVLNSFCPGVWIESLRCFGSEGLKPITRYESTKIIETLRQHHIKLAGVEECSVSC